MALQLTYTTPYGFDANYWKIVRTVTNSAACKFYMELALYKDAAAAAAGKEPVITIDHEWELTEGCPVLGAIPQGSSTPLEATQDAVYAAIKTMTIHGIDFTQAQDV